MAARDTIQALAEITDEGLFERVAMAVLRIADPHCIALSHPGVNASGKTRKAPLDGIGFVPGAKPPHLVAVHHTTCKANDLRDKWLHDPATVKPRKTGGKPTAPPGDLIKTANIIAAERARTADLEATLFLTWNGEPDTDLIRDAKAVGAEHRIEVRVWPGSGLAHVLDTTPGGQWIRRKLLDIEQELLSSELLAELSKVSHRELAPCEDPPRAWAPRNIDDVLRSTRRPINFIAAESGFGKTVACFRAVIEHVEKGGYGLILPHELVEQSSTFEQAVSAALRQLHPSLAPGQTPLAFCTPDKPLVVLVEDINRSGQPERLAAKLARWGHNSGDPQLTKSWRLFCPIWPRVVALMEEQTRRVLEAMLVSLEPMTEAEACYAVIVRAQLSGRNISKVRASEISEALGNDPLLIALHDFNREPDANSVLDAFIERALERAQEADGGPSFEFRDALLALAAQMLQRRCLSISWQELVSWDVPAETLCRIQFLAQRRELIWWMGPSTDLRLVFRHDRIRDWLLIEAAELMGDDLPDGILGDPFFAEIFGALIARRGASPLLLERARLLNPLVLFHALRECPQSSLSEKERGLIAQAIEKWLAVPANIGLANRKLCWEALAALQGTDGPEVVPIVKRIPCRGRSEQLARLRNGDIDAGIEMCLNSEPGMRDSLRDHHIEHAKLKFGEKLIHVLSKLLQQRDLDGHARSGLLRFAGHVGDPKLGTAIETCWSSDTSRENRLDDYLWAFARTCGPSTAERYLAPVCAAWAALPDKREGNKASPRDALAANSLRWAFQSAIPDGAIDYFIARAQKPDLCWQITYMMHGMDEPRATAFIVTELAKRADGLGATLLRSAVLDHWRRAQEEGRPMSPANRRQLLNTWQDPSIDMKERIAAFDVWSSTREEGDLPILQAAACEVDLADRVLRQRRDRGDYSVTAALVEKIRERNQGHWWWFNAHHVWNAELSETLDYVLTWRRDHLPEPWGEGTEEDRSTQDIITRLPVQEAEGILVGHWDHLRFCKHFVQAALYLGTMRLCHLAAQSIAEAPEPAAMLENLTLGWHIRVWGHPGVTRSSQLLGVEPYLHLLSESDLFSLADACNLHGWFDLRRRLFDHRITRYRVAWSPEGAAARFDAMLRHKHWIDREIDDALSTGTTWAEYLDAMTNWVAQRQTLDAFQLLAGALAYKGSRQDLCRLQIYEGMPREIAEAIVKDVTFAVQRRSAS